MNKLNLLLVLFYFSSILPLLSQNNPNAASSITNSRNMATLPEVLLSFDAIINDKKVELTWASNSEQNNNYFTIEKSKDALSFEKLTTIKNFGNNSTIISYFDVDYTPFEGISYYRLIQTNTKGTLLSSRIVSVNYRSENKNLTLYSDASTDEHIDLMGTENKETLVVLRNEKGEEHVSKVLVDEHDAVKIISDNDIKLDNGTYIIIASSDNKLYSKIIKVNN